MLESNTNESVKMIMHVSSGTKIPAYHLAQAFKYQQACFSYSWEGACDRVLLLLQPILCTNWAAVTIAIIRGCYAAVKGTTIGKGMGHMILSRRQHGLTQVMPQDTAQ